MEIFKITFFFFSFFIVSGPLQAQSTERKPADQYQKREFYIPMRDGIKLHTTVYVPKDISKDKKYPFLMARTCYSCQPYGAEQYPDQLRPSRYMQEEGYIFVCQDVRGRWMSEGAFDNMRPQIPDKLKKNKKDIDESTDTYDTIEWLIKNIEHNNGRVGQWGISYPGFYAAVGALSGHPALKASSPQAPIADFYFDDFHHQGAYTMGYWFIHPVFSYQHKGPTTQSWYNFVRSPTRDAYQFLLDLGALSNTRKYYKEDAFFWNELVAHPNYDDFWQKRNLLPHLKNVKHAVLTIGGWFDAEDLYGPLKIYQHIEKNNPGIFNQIVMGPWGHGDWSRTRKETMVGNIYFGDNICDYYQREIEAPFFRHFLKDGPKPELPEALMFDTGKKEWGKYAQWPLPNIESKKMYFHTKEQLNFNAPQNPESYSEYLSDPAKPVPYSEDLELMGTPRKYMSDDQRFASRRPDVLVFQTEVLEEDLTLAGEINAFLKVSTTGTDADWVVKLIDVYPPDEPNSEYTPKHIKLAGYQQMVRSEVFRSRFRNSFEKPEAMVPNQVTDIKVPLQDVYHTFKKGHRIMVQVQSTWFPLIDRNPQKFVENIFKASDSDFIKATQRVYHSASQPSHLEVKVLKK